MEAHRTHLSRFFLGSIHCHATPQTAPGVTVQRPQTPTNKILIALALAATLGGCATAKDDSGAAVDPDVADEYTGPPLNFDEMLTEVLVPSCGFDACHGSGAGYLRIHDAQTEDEWLDMESIIVANEKLIRPGDAANSYLIKKMEGAPDIQGDQMPPSGVLSGYRVGQVRSWIDSLE